MAARKARAKWLSLILTVLWVASLMVVVTPRAVAGGEVSNAAEFEVSLNAAEEVTDLSEFPIPNRDGPESRFGETNATGQVTIEVVHEAGADDAIREEVGRLGGEVLGASPGVLLVEVSPAAAAILESRPDVEYLRSPVRVDLLPDPRHVSRSLLEADGLQAISDVHVSVTNAAAWLNAGHRGDGVKVGIIDFFDGALWSAVQSAGGVPAPAGTFCLFYGGPCDLWTGASKHGVAVAEIVHDMAPGASLYLATVGSTTDLAAAVAWFDSQGVQIISRSLASQLDGAGDGTGSVDDIVDDAVSRGMLWLNSAGNHASASGTYGGGYWRGSWSDATANSFLEFAPGDEALAFPCGYIQGFRWSDWQATGRTDYDILITDFTTGDALAISANSQVAGAPPLEVIDPALINCDLHPILNLWVFLYNPGSGTGGDTLEFMANIDAFEYSSNPYSATQPAADSANSGAVAVGAIDPAAGGVIATYSSQGPTNDHRITPSLSAPSCLPTYSYAPGCFNGTSAATPVAAGAAALVWGADVATTPQSVAEYLRTHVVDLGAPGADPIYGTGQLYLGDPPPPNMAPVVSAGSDQTITLPSTAALDGTVTDDGRPSGSLSSTWSKVTGPGSVTFADQLAVDTRATFTIPGVYGLRLTATDGELTTAADVTITVMPLSVVVIPDFFTDDEGSIFEDDNNWMAAMGITMGCNPPLNDEYCPDANVTRGQMAAFLVRALHLTERLDDPFFDDDGLIFEGDIERLAAAEVTKGCNPPLNDQFCPDDYVTRGQMAAFLVRALGYTDNGGGGLFGDSGDSIFADAIDRLATAGVTRGCNPPMNTQFCPDSSVTRGQMAAFLHRALG